MSDKQNEKDIIANVSHDLKGPIAAILGYAELIISSPDTPVSARENAQKIAASGRSMLELVTRLLDNDNKGENAYSIYDMLFELRGSTIGVISSKPVELFIKCESSVPEHLYGDSVSVKRILANLLSNAAKYTHKGSITLCVSYSDGILTAKVSDTGIGIKSDDIKNLFKKHKRFDQEKNKDIEGTGLGLAIAKELAESLGGELSAESEYGKGSTFTVKIPQKKV